MPIEPDMGLVRNVAQFIKDSARGDDQHKLANSFQLAASELLKQGLKDDGSRGLARFVNEYLAITKQTGETLPEDPDSIYTREEMLKLIRAHCAKEEESILGYNRFKGRGLTGNLPLCLKPHSTTLFDLSLGDSYEYRTFHRQLPPSTRSLFTRAFRQLARSSSLLNLGTFRVLLLDEVLRKTNGLGPKTAVLAIGALHKPGLDT